MRRLIAVAAVGAIGCGSSAEEPTSGPISSIVHRSEHEVRLKAVRHRASLAELPVDYLGLPMRGEIEIDADLTIPVVGPRLYYPKATGTLAFRCIGPCTIGDDVAKLKPRTTARSAALLGDGIDFGHVELARLEAKVRFADGRAVLSRWVLESTDLEVDLAARIELGAELDRSVVDGCIRFKPTEALQAREPKTYWVFSLIGGALAPDGLFHIRITGPVGDIKPRGQICDPPTP